MRTLGIIEKYVRSWIQKTKSGWFCCWFRLQVQDDIFLYSLYSLLQTHILSGRHLFKHGVLMNTLWMSESVWWCVSPHPSFRLCLSSHPCRGWPARACPQWCWWASSAESVGDYEEVFMVPDPSTDWPYAVLKGVRDGEWGICWELGDVIVVLEHVPGLMFDQLSQR